MLDSLPNPPPPPRESRFSKCILLCLLIGGACIAWRLRYVQDDAFIAFEFGRSIASGDGPTWLGERVEGYTNGLWIVALAAAHALQIEPIAFSQTLGIVCWLAALVGIWNLAGTLGLGLGGRSLSIALCVSNYSFSANATGGLETPLITAIATFVYANSVHLARGAESDYERRLTVLAWTAAAAVLTRFDSIVLVLGSLLPWIPTLLATNARARTLRACSIPSIVLASWFLLRWSYYDKLLPNPYYAKVPHDLPSIGAGIVYVSRYLHWYLIWPWLAGAGWMLLSIRNQRHTVRQVMPVIGAAMTWFAYLAYIGGDFMEFRLMTPVLPALAVGTVYVLDRTLRSVAVRAYLAVIAMAALPLASWQHAHAFRAISSDATLDSIPALATCYGMYPDGDWSRIGVVLGSELGSSSTPVTIATSASGAIPYYSQLRTLDILGLCNQDLPEVGLRAGREYLRPGHRLSSSVDFMRRFGVDLVVGHPLIIETGSLTAAPADYLTDHVRAMVPLDTHQIGTALLVAMPLQDGTSLVMWWLSGCDAVNEKVASKKWEFRRVNVVS